MRILVTGGSQGAAALNRAVPAALAQLQSPWQVLHQCGTGQVAAVRARYGEHAGVEVTEYIEDMLEAYRWAHVVISRAGALTVAELAAAGRPAVLVPFPHSAGGHQEANARAAEDRGTAACLLQAQLGSAERAEGLADLLTSLATDPVRLGSMAAAAAVSAPRDAARVIVDELLALAGPIRKGN